MEGRFSEEVKRTLAYWRCRDYDGWKSALHESGHALALLLLKHPVKRLTLKDCEAGTLRMPDRDRAIVAAAGGVAAHLAGFTPAGFPLSSTDEEQLAWGGVKHADERQTAIGNAYTLLELPGAWAGVMAVAEALYSTGELSGREVERIAREAGRAAHGVGQ